MADSREVKIRERLVTKMGGYLNGIYEPSFGYEEYAKNLETLLLDWVSMEKLNNMGIVNRYLGE